MTIVEVHADITCPFAHVGLQHIARHVEAMADPADVIVRAWPLEWVNGAPLDVDPVIVKARALTEQLGVDSFSGLSAQQWPSSTLAALNLVASAYERDTATGWAMSLRIREALFGYGADINDPAVLADLAAGSDLPAPTSDASAAVLSDYDRGKQRGVKGSPHFFIGSDDFFCPSLDLGHDDDGALTARIDTEGLTAFFARLDA